MILTKRLTYPVLAVTFMLMSPGNWTVDALLNLHRDFWPGVWMYLPSPIIYLMALAANDRLFVRLLLLNGKFGRYAISVFFLSLTAALFASGVEHIITMQLDLPHRSPMGFVASIMTEGFANSLWLFLILLGDALIRLYGKLKCDALTEKSMSNNLRRYVREVNRLLSPTYIFTKLDEIRDAICRDASTASELIGNFSEWLRQQLSLMPKAPDVVPHLSERSLFSSVLDIMVGSKYRCLRHVVAVTTLIFVILFMAAYDQSGDAESKLGVGVLVFSELAIIPYVIYFWLYRRFKRTMNLRRYVRNVTMLLGVLIFPMLVSIPIYLVKASAAHTSTASQIVYVLSLIAGIVSLLLYEFGISALLFFMNWIRTHRCISVLKTETLKQEYLFLRKQINPHFLFNVLNNVEITAYEDADYAVQLIGDISRLLHYQLDRNVDETITVNEEVDFLKSYLALESSRRDCFGYEITADESIADVRIPRMLLITFFENASKYSSPDYNGLNIKASFHVGNNRLRFECRNHYNTMLIKSTHHSAIGIENTRRRLELLYDGNASLEISDFNGIYSVELSIPLNIKIHENKVHNSR